jgi:hypothetical protein
MRQHLIVEPVSGISFANSCGVKKMPEVKNGKMEESRSWNFFPGKDFPRGRVCVS